MTYTCPECGALSHNPHDEAERYCGRCHQYEERAKNTRLAQLLAEAQCWCGRGRCCRVHQTHTMPHKGCILR